MEPKPQFRFPKHITLVVSNTVTANTRSTHIEYRIRKVLLFHDIRTRKKQDFRFAPCLAVQNAVRLYRFREEL